MAPEPAAEIDLVEAARRLGVTYQRAWQLVTTGRLEGVRQFGRWRVTVASVEGYLATRPKQEVRG